MLVRSFFLMFSIILLWSLQACKENEPDPCMNEMPITADFYIGNQIAGFSDAGGLFFPDSLFVTDDTLWAKSYVHFVAKEREGYRYEWKIGNDDRVFTEASFSLFFSSVQINLPIRLIVRASPNLSCFATDDGIDTMYRYLTLLPREIPSPMKGKYRGHLSDDPQTEFEVEIKLEPKFDGFDPIHPQVYNINPGCTALDDKNTSRTLEIVPGYRNLLIMPNLGYNADQGCFVPRGWASLNQTWDTLTINYSIQPDKASDTRENHQFIGHRIE